MICYRVMWITNKYRKLWPVIKKKKQLVKYLYGDNTTTLSKEDK